VSLAYRKQSSLFRDVRIGGHCKLADFAAHMSSKHVNDICSKDSLHRTTQITAALATRLEKEYDILNRTTYVRFSKMVLSIRKSQVVTEPTKHVSVVLSHVS
jgi:hypothetical protein